jgi:hypothetical protein
MNYPPIIVINLDTRQDRWLEIQEHFSKNGWENFMKYRFSAIKNDEGWVGCRESHIQCIKIAKENNFPWVIVIEDDCIPRPNSFTQFSELLPTLWETRKTWDIFLGGITTATSPTIINRNPLLISCRGCCAHFCLYPTESYDTLLSEAISRYSMIDAVFKESPNLRVLCTYPFIAFQKPSRSDIVYTIENNIKIYTDTDYSASFIEAEKAIEKVLCES